METNKNIKKIKWLIIPDVHCREFWKEPVKEVLDDTDARIVFLGDYLDGYAHEWNADDDYRRRGIDNLKSIIQLKREHPERIVLLVGNHDCGYAISTSICDCRTDGLNFVEIAELFKNNWDCFQLAAEDTINGRHFIFSHAGINKEYAKIVFGDSVDENNVVEKFNSAWRKMDYKVLKTLRQYSFLRGYDGYDFGSLVWADIHEWFLDTGYTNEPYGYAVVGHTQQESAPVIGDKIACLDVRRAFVLYDDGEILAFDDDWLRGC